VLTIVPLYFKLANYTLTSIRKSPSWRGLFGTDGAISQNLLPQVDTNAAVTMAVGQAADGLACSFVLERLRKAFPTQFRQAQEEAGREATTFLVLHKHPKLDSNDVTKYPCRAATLIATQLESVRTPSPTSSSEPAPVPSPPENVIRHFFP
jgi:hypothetical protein